MPRYQKKEYLEAYAHPHRALSPITYHINLVSAMQIGNEHSESKIFKENCETVAKLRFVISTRITSTPSVKDEARNFLIEQSGNDTALVMLLRSFVEFFALHAERIAFLNQIIKLLASRQNGIDSIVKHLLCLFKILLYFGYFISFCGVLIFLQRLFQRRKGHAIISRFLRKFSFARFSKIIQKLCYDRKCDALWILCICNTYASNSSVSADDVYVIS